MSLPMELDIEAMISDLNRWGWSDWKICSACGYSDAYIAQVRAGRIKMMSYQRAARLYNFWESEKSLRNESMLLIASTK